MPAVLVVVDAVDGSAPKPTLELLTLAARIGTPAAVVFGPAASQAVPALAEYGAAEVYLVPDPQVLTISWCRRSMRSSRSPGRSANGTSWPPCCSRRARRARRS